MFDGSWVLPNALAKNLDRHAAWLQPRFATADGKLNMSGRAAVDSEFTYSLYSSNAKT